MPIAHIDEIKERNKAEFKEEYEFKMPFFLDIEHKD